MRSLQGFVEVQGARLHYEIEGSGRPVLLIHAANTDARMWEETAAALSSRYRIIRYDMRGMGRSEMGTEGYTAYRDIEGVLDAVDIGACTLVGVSAGGYCALEFVLAQPRRVASLVLVSAGLFASEASESDEHKRAAAELAAAGDLEAMAEAYARMWLDGPGQSSARVSAQTRRRFLAMAKDAFARRAEYRFPELMTPEPGKRLREIACPTLVIDGELDFPESHLFAELFAREIPGARRITLAGSAHLPPLDQPEAFHRILREFLAEREGAP